MIGHNRLGKKKEKVALLRVQIGVNGVNVNVESCTFSPVFRRRKQPVPYLKYTMNQLKDHFSLQILEENYTKILTCFSPARPGNTSVQQVLQTDPQDTVFKKTDLIIK